MEDFIIIIIIIIIIIFWSGQFRNKKGTGAEICPAVVSGIVTGDAPVSNC